MAVSNKFTKAKVKQILCKFRTNKFRKAVSEKMVSEKNKFSGEMQDFELVASKRKNGEMQDLKRVVGV